MEINTKDSTYFLNNLEDIIYIQLDEITWAKKTEYRINIYLKEENSIHLKFEETENRDYYYDTIKKRLLENKKCYLYKEND